MSMMLGCHIPCQQYGHDVTIGSDPMESDRILYVIHYLVLIVLMKGFPKADISLWSQWIFPRFWEAGEGESELWLIVLGQNKHTILALGCPRACDPLCATHTSRFTGLNGWTCFENFGKSTGNNPSFMFMAFCMLLISAIYFGIRVMAIFFFPLMASVYVLM